MSAAERVHEPSPIQWMRARQDGIIARSAELNRSLVLCCGLGGILLFAGTAQELLAGFLRKQIQAAQISVGAIQTTEVFDNLLELLSPILFFVVGLFVFSLVVWQMQSPLVVRVSKMAPDFSRLWNPANVFGVFDRDKLMRVGLGALFFVLVTAGAIWFVVVNQWNLVTLMGVELHEALRLTNLFLKNAMIGTGALLLVFGILDYARERLRIGNQLKMTDQERREEARENEADPRWRRTIHTPG